MPTIMETKQPIDHPAWLHFLLSAACAVAAWFLWPLGQRREEWLTIIALVLGLCSLKYVLSGFASWDRKVIRRRIEDSLDEAGDQHGTSHWASLEEVKKVGLLKRDGLFIGALNKKDLFYRGETHLLTIAPPGAGKGTCLAIPNLLNYPGSIIVTDPKAELYCTTARHRREKLGHEIIVLAPWAEKMSAELECEVPDHGFNPLSILKDGPDIKDDAELISSLLLPGKAGMGASDEFWNDAGQTLLTAFILFLHSRYETFDLPLLRKQLLSQPELLFHKLDDMAHSPDFQGVLAELGGKLLGTLKHAPQQFEGAMGTAQKALRIYDPVGPLARHVSRGTVDFAALKETPKTIYLIMPSDRIGTHAAWLNMVISLAIELVGRDRSNRRVLFLLDEFANLGYLPNVLRGMAQYRGQGVQVWSIIQQISQLERLYRREGMREVIGMSEVVNTFGIWEPDTLKMVSSWLGNQTLREVRQNIDRRAGGGIPSMSLNASDHGAPLLRGDDIRTMPSDEQLIFYKNLPPIRAQKVSYLRRASWRRNADPNPCFRKS